MDNQLSIVFILLGIGLVYAMIHRLFWIIVIFLGGVASFFTMIASIITFQIALAMVFFIISLICAGILRWLMDDY